MGVIKMGIVSHDYKIFGFTSGKRPNASGGLLMLTMVSKTPNRAINDNRISAKRGMKRLFLGLTARDNNKMKLKIKVDGKTNFANGSYAIYGLTEFDGTLHNVEIFVSADSAEADYVKLTQNLPLIAIKLPDTI